MKLNKIDFHDLQCRNTVMCKVSNDAGIYHVTALDGLHHKIMLDGPRMGMWYDIDKIKGILITPEILINRGAILKSGHFEMDLTRFHKLHIFQEGRRWTAKYIQEVITSHGIFFKPIFYLHELENIYYIFKKQHLELK